MKSKVIVLLVFFLTTAMSLSAQSKVLQSTRLLGEAEFHFEVMYKIVDCGDGKPSIHLTAFNESGIKTDVAFDIELKDKKTGTLQEIKVPFFYIKPFSLFQASCDDDKLLFLKYKLDAKIDYTDMDVKIKFYSK